MARAHPLPCRIERRFSGRLTSGEFFSLKTLCQVCQARAGSALETAQSLGLDPQQQPHANKQRQGSRQPADQLRLEQAHREQAADLPADHHCDHQRQARARRLTKQARAVTCLILV